MAYSTVMVTRRIKRTTPPVLIRKSTRKHLYIEEWMAHRGLGDEQVAGRLDVARETVTRYRGQQHRLNPDKIAAIAHALDCEPEELWRPPGRPSLDAMVKDATDDLRATAADIVKRLVGRG